MELFLLKKEKNRVYDSKDICQNALCFDLEYDGEKPLGCSISDTKKYWACAIGVCGVDIEQNDRYIKETTINALHPDEKKYMKALAYGTDEWNTEFLHIWTEKEAVFKLLGKRFKEYSVFDEKLQYLPEIEEYKVVYRKDKELTYCVISNDDFFEITPIEYSGKHDMSCMDCAAELLGRKSYSKTDLKNKLKIRGYEAEEIDAAISEFEDLGYINDAEYAKRFAERFLERGKGAAYIKSKLIIKGISQEDMPEIDSKAQYESALEFAKSLYEPQEDYAEKKKMMDKIARKLASKGFESSIIFKVLDSIND